MSRAEGWDLQSLPQMQLAYDNHCWSGKGDKPISARTVGLAADLHQQM